MDPITHAVIGIMIGSKSAGGLTLANGALVASTLGAVMPDLDIVAAFWGDYAYLKQHRCFSHSIPGLVLISFGLAAALTPFYPGAALAGLAFWAFLGAFSHSLVDMFNSYGVKTLWPFSRKRWTASLLMIFDPVIFALVVFMIIAGHNRMYNLAAAGGILFYLVLRFLMRRWAYYLVKRRLSRRYPGVRVVVLPSIRYFFKWDFIARLPQKDMVGTVSLLRRRFRIVRRLRRANDKIAKTLSESALGILFREFTPFCHINCELEGDMLVGRFIDLRYFNGADFLHNGTLIMDRNMRVKEAVFQPFNKSRRHDLHNVNK